MEAITVRIDPTIPAGLKAVRELGTKKYAKIEEPLPVAVGETSITMDDLFQEAEDYLNAHYGTKMKI